MEFVLTYKGRIPAKASNRDVMWDMRRSFDRQLRKLWGKPPFTILAEWEASDFAGGAPNFLIKRGTQTFVPLYGMNVGVGVSLDIKLLTGLPERKPVISAGDLDNRIKRIIDALRAAANNDELAEDLPPASRWHCLMDDDSSVLSLTASLGPYLGCDDPAESFAVITVRPIAARVSISNLEMLF